MDYLTVKDIARDIAAGGVPLETARARAVSYTQHAFIRIRATGLRTAPNEYAFSDCAAAIVLAQIQDTGVADHATLLAASRALYRWSSKSAERDARLLLPGTHRLPSHPIDRCIEGIARRGESWSLLLNFWRDTQTDERLVDADLCRADCPFIGQRTIEPTMTPRGALIAVLDESMSPVVRRLNGGKAQH